MYYAENPDAAHDIHELRVELLGQKMTFLTDAGVFSKKIVDFGSQLLLKCLEVNQGETVLDVGCGYGPLGLSLAKAYGVQATMVDINTRALDLARRNAEKNNAKATIFQSNIYEQVEGHFDHVISNPPIRAGKQVVHEIIEKSKDFLETGGDLTIVIQKKQGAPSAKSKMEDVFGNCEILKKDKGYYILDGVKVDKHSTGGVGDKVTLILAPLVASFGVPVAKMSGRGLGHTGGTIDKLESIRGYQVERSQEDFIRQVQDIGVSVIGQSDQLVKADKLLYALRDVTATVDTIPLIASSVMSKKIAAGADAILLDVTVGEGAFMKTVDEARELAQTMVDLGKVVGRKTVAVITDMSQPLGRAIGNRLEILEALEILQGQGRQDITHFICELAQIMLGLANVNKTVEEVRQHLENGQALAKFEEMVQAQGGDLEDLYRPVNVAHVVEIPAQETGVISALPAMDFGLYAMRLGAGRAVKSDALDYETGIVFEKKIGDSVQKGEIVAKVYTNEKIPPQLVTDFQKCVKISDEVKKIREIVEIIS